VSFVGSTTMRTPSGSPPWIKRRRVSTPLAPTAGPSTVSPRRLLARIIHDLRPGCGVGHPDSTSLPVLLGIIDLSRAK